MTLKGSLPILGQPSPIEPRDVHLVGRYALGVTWADGHSSIYPFEQLRVGEADATAAAPLPASAMWPRDIKRLGEGLKVTWADGHERVYPYADLRARCRCAGCTGGH